MTEYGIKELKRRVKENKVLTFEERKYINKALEEIQAYRAIGTVEELQKSVKEEDILKFYYIKSEDKYVVGQRVDTMYYAEVGKTGLCFYMSRYLPWGEHVVAPDTLWKEHTYPSEPKEIPFFDWLQGFMRKEYGSTIEEFKALKEKNEPKKPYVGRFGVIRCSCCDEEVGQMVTSVLKEDCMNFCAYCGRMVDWSE